MKSSSRLGMCFEESSGNSAHIGNTATEIRDSNQLLSRWIHIKLTGNTKNREMLKYAKGT